MNDLPEHLRPIEIPAPTLRRWLDVARILAQSESAVLLEVQGLHGDQTPHRLQRCIKAARWVEKVAPEPYRTGARMLADEIERTRQDFLIASAKAS